MNTSSLIFFHNKSHSLSWEFFIEQRLWWLQILKNCVKFCCCLFSLVFCSVWICNSLLELIQGHLILKPFKKISFQRQVEKQPVDLSLQSVILHLKAFKRVLKEFDFGWLYYQNNSISCFDKSIDWFLKFFNSFVKSVKFVLVGF